MLNIIKNGAKARLSAPAVINKGNSIIVIRIKNGIHAILQNIRSTDFMALLALHPVITDTSNTNGMDTIANNDNIVNKLKIIFFTFI